MIYYRLLISHFTNLIHPIARKEDAVHYTVKVAALVVALALLAPTPVFADYISDAASALQDASVYVVPGTEGTDNDTAGKLQGRLDKDDHIVLVMLPATAEEELGADINTIAARLSEELEHQRIIGLAVGKDVVGYAPALPTGVAADQMRRADSVSNDPVTALGTFAQNMHIWQEDNPEPIPLLDPPQEEGGSSWIMWVVFGVIAAIVFLIVIVFPIAISDQDTSESKERTSFKAPDQVKDLLAKIVRARHQVHDGALQETLYQMCVHIERYFDRSSSDKKRDSSFFKERLTEVANVLDKYIDVQGSPLYYFEPEDELHRGKSAITDFAHYVLDAIRRGNAADLVDYKVNTKILEAQRHR